MGLQCEWMLQCYLRHNILSEREEKEQRGEKCLQYPSDHLSTSQRGHPPLQDFFTLSWCVYSAMSLSPFTLLLCLLTAGVKYWAGFHIPLRLAHSQPLCVFVALGRESGCGRNTAMWEQPSTNWWNMGLIMAVKGHTWDVCLEPAGSWLLSASH